MCYIKKWNRSGRENPSPQLGYQSPNVFTPDQERSLSDYLARSAKMNFGLSAREVRKLAYQSGVKYSIAMPPAWLRNFLKGTGNLSLRRPEATSLASGMGFNRTTFSNLATLMYKHHFGPQDIYNMDETGVTTVQKPTCIIA